MSGLCLQVRRPYQLHDHLWSAPVTTHAECKLQCMAFGVTKRELTQNVHLLSDSSLGYPQATPGPWEESRRRHLEVSLVHSPSGRVLFVCYTKGLASQIVACRESSL